MKIFFYDNIINYSFKGNKMQELIINENSIKDKIHTKR